MSRTRRKVPVNWYDHEGGWARKVTRKQARVKASQLMQTGKYDLAGQRTLKGTGGWISR